MDTPLSVTNMFSNMITNPSAVFDSIKLKTSFMFPLLLAIVLTQIMFYWYFQLVDPTWFTEHMIMISGEDLAPDQIEEMKKFMKPSTIMPFTLIGTSIGMIVVVLLQALYLMVVGNTKNIDVSYGEWFSLSAWSLVPAILLSIMILFNLSIGDISQLPMELMNPINFASLLGIEGPGSLYNTLAGISIVTFLSLYLVAAGFKHWSNGSWTASVILVAIPYVLFWLAQIFIF